MRTLLALLFCIVVGCNHCPRFLDCSPCNKETIECQTETADCRSKNVTKKVCVSEPTCPKPVCEVKQALPVCERPPEVKFGAPKPIHVMLPPQKIIVQNEMQSQAMPIVQQQAMMQPQSFAPQSFAPQAMVPQQMMMMPMMQPQSAAPAGRARPGLTFR